MAERMKQTEPFQSGQSTTDRGHPAQKVPLKTKMAKVRNFGQPDPLRDTLMGAGQVPQIHADVAHFHFGGGGKPYKPEGEFGRPKGGY